MTTLVSMPPIFGISYLPILLCFVFCVCVCVCVCVCPLHPHPPDSQPVGPVSSALDMYSAEYKGLSAQRRYPVSIH